MTDNEVIAVFMGFTPYGNGIWWNVPKGEDLKYKAFKLHRDKLSYSTSWDWLMPVVEKIEAMERTLVNIYGDATVIAVDAIDGVEIYGKTNHGNKDNKIGHAYRAVVEFIKWYNENNKCQTQ